MRFALRRNTVADVPSPTPKEDAMMTALVDADSTISWTSIPTPIAVVAEAERWAFIRASRDSTKTTITTPNVSAEGNVSGFYIKLYRWSETGVALLHSSPNMADRLSDEPVVVTDEFPPIKVLAGHIYGIEFTVTGPGFVWLVGGIATPLPPKPGLPPALGAVGSLNYTHTVPYAELG